ncbi:30S ribosomal protein S6 [Propioniciclava tarda]|uniref:Small ribosomal subunit protein bS6 n=1 Tax=Propioniciclava tarda TaxID=433330 RepID=A0A4Q9KNQ6_PROTD|nr:30S ribosomal protein S6 [Propioniciclava tarda]SMO34096.1 small subunit ribosomal protein S6 [Propioniciclava tarda]
MRKYEICVIVHPDVDDRQVNGLLDKNLASFTAAGGTVDSIEVAGRRRLAYEIQKKPEGIYIFLKLTAEPAAVKELDRLFTLNEQIMRTKVFRDDSKKALKAKPRNHDVVVPPEKPSKPARQYKGDR